MNVIKIKALKTEDYITVGLHSQGVRMLMRVRGYHSPLESRRQRKHGGHLLFKAGPDTSIFLPLHY